LKCAKIFHRGRSYIGRHILCLSGSQETDLELEVQRSH